jgi:hypothetical protein
MKRDILCICGPDRAANEKIVEILVGLLPQNNFCSSMTLAPKAYVFLGAEVEFGSISEEIERKKGKSELLVLPHMETLSYLLDHYRNRMFNIFIDSLENTVVRNFENMYVDLADETFEGYIQRSRNQRKLFSHYKSEFLLTVQQELNPNEWVAKCISRVIKHR